FRDYVWRTFKARLLDMESAAVAHVAYANGVPFLAVRSLSDLAGGNGEANEMTTFMALASRNSAAVVMAVLRDMP
ncbi:MAG: phosphorylase, partial [Parvibaculaceae bacterium]